MLRLFASWKTLLACGLMLAVSATSLPAAEISQKEVDEMVAKAIDYLKAKGQKEDGSFSPASPAVTSLVTAALLRHGRTPADPTVAKSLKYIESFIQADGGIHTPDSKWKNYETSLSVLAFTEANKDGRYDAALKKADAFLKGLQWDETEDKGKDDPYFGGAGYGGSKRPDLSNTGFLIDALKATGNDANSEALQRALVFVSRCQNLESEYNTTPFAAKVNDGGFYYTPAGGGQSQAGPTENGGLKSYGSMTYAGLKSMIYAGVKKDDPRVVAAVKWLRKNYDLKQNPGMDQAGLFYYYNTVAKALAAYGEDDFKDDKGTSHNWRQELLAELKSRQNADGSWANANTKWMEGDANLVTGYALLALSHLPKK